MPLSIRTRRTASEAPAKEPLEETAREPKEVLDEDEIVDSAQGLLNRIGLRLPKKPKDAKGRDIELEFPDDVSAISTEELGKLHGQYTTMVDYVRCQLALYDIRHMTTKHNERVTHTLEGLRSKGSSVKEREARGMTSEKSSARSQAHYVRVAEYKLLSAVYEGYLDKKGALSREITRREKQREKES